MRARARGAGAVERPAFEQAPPAAKGPRRARGGPPAPRSRARARALVAPHAALRARQQRCARVGHTSRPTHQPTPPACNLQPPCRHPTWPLPQNNHATARVAAPLASPPTVRSARPPANPPGTAAAWPASPPPRPRRRRRPGAGGACLRPRLARCRPAAFTIPQVPASSPARPTRFRRRLGRRARGEVAPRGECAGATCGRRRSHAFATATPAGLAGRQKAPPSPRRPPPRCRADPRPLLSPTPTPPPPRTRPAARPGSRRAAPTRRRRAA